MESPRDNAIIRELEVQYLGIVDVGGVNYEVCVHFLRIAPLPSGFCKSGWFTFIYDVETGAK